MTIQGVEMFKKSSRGVGRDLAIAFSGFYCLLIGYLIFRSTFLPHILSALMAFAGLCWTTYLSTPLVSKLSPYNLASGLPGRVW
jgi:hypothetical protein